MADSKKYNGSTWEHSLRKLTTATDTFTTLPVDVYADGNNATVSISGNTVQSSIPSPTSPIMPQGTGERTGNLLDRTAFTGVSATIEQIKDGIRIITKSGGYAARIILDVLPNTNYTVSYIFKRISGTTANTVRVFAGTGDTTQIASFDYKTGGTFNTGNNTKINIWFYAAFSTTATVEYTKIMLNLGSTPLPYEPYGYKIPISNGQQTTNIYLGSTQTVRQIYKYVCTGEENWNNNFGVSLFGAQNLLNSHPFIPRVQAYCTHCVYNPVQSGIDANTHNGDIVLQQSGGSGYNVFIKNTDYTTNEDFKSWLVTEYANGTPVIIWYVLATAETTSINEPLMKIGDYADTLSNATAIPTTEGANSITVDTTVQPSEFTATWTGWHNAEVKEKSENLWGDTTETNKYIDGQGNTGTASNGDIFGRKGMTVVSSTNYTFSWSDVVLGSEDNTPYIRICFYTSNGGTFISRTLVNPNDYLDKYVSFTIPNNCTYVDIRIDSEASTRGQHFVNLMLNTGSTALPYEPYWK